SWRKYNRKIDGRVLNNKHNNYVKIGIYKELFETINKQYKKNNKNRKKESIKVLSIDSTFVQNKNGIEKIGRNIYYKNKQGRKIRSLKKKEMKKYRKRIIVENYFSWIKMYPKIDKIYEKTEKSYKKVY